MTREHVLENLLESRNKFASIPTTDDFAGRTYGPGKWAVRQVLAHVSDAEMIGLWRFSRAVAEHGSTVEPFDEAKWALEMQYDRRDIGLSRGIFLASRDLLIAHLRNLPDEAFHRVAVHPEKGRQSAMFYAHLSHYHTLHHLTQVDAALSGQPWMTPRLPMSKYFGAAE